MIHPGLLFNDITLTEGYKNRTKTPWSTWEANIKNIANDLMQPYLTSAMMQESSHWDFGENWDAVTKDNYLYLAAGEQVRIYDISTKDRLLNLSWKQTDIFPARPELGTFKEGTPPINILHTNGFIEGLYIEGNYLYIANRKYFVIADISNPRTSYIVSSLNVGGRDVIVSGNYAYITKDASPNQGINIIDISNKANPVLVRTLPLAGFNRPRRMDISGNYLYATLEYDGRLDIIDISNPLNPSVAGSYAKGISTPYNYYSSVAVRDNYAYVVEYHNGLRVIDVSNPASPVEVSTIIGTPNQHNYNDIKLFGGYAFVSERYQGFDIIDISNPTSVSIIKHVDVLPAYEEGIFVASLTYGNYTFLSANTQGLGIIDISDITNPKHEATVITPGGGDSIDVKGNYAYIGAHNVGIWVVDISDSTNPKEVALVKNNGRNEGIEVQGDYLYVASTWSDLCVVNISDPLNPKLIVYGYGNPVSGPLIADGNYLYNGNNYLNEKSIAINHLTIYDISNPANPSIIYNGDLGFGLGAFVSAKYGTNYLLGGGQNGFFIVDISNKTNPQVVGKYSAINPYGGDIKVIGNIAYVGADVSMLYAFDISDVTNPLVLGKLDVVGTNNLVIYGNHAYVLPRYDSWGFDEIDVSNPKNMKILKTVYIGGEDMVESNGLLYTSSGYIITLTPIQTCPTPICNFTLTQI